MTTAQRGRLSGGDGRWSASWWFPSLFRWAGRIELPGTPTAMALIAAFGLAWLAERCGSAMIIGAFAAGLLVVAAPQAHEIERGITEIGHFFVPLFFVAVGASVDLSALDPFKPASRFALVTGGVLIVVGRRRQARGRLCAVLVPRQQDGRRRRDDPSRRGRADLRPDRPGVGGLRRGPLRRRHPHGDGHDAAGPALPEAAPGAAHRADQPATSSKGSKTSSPKLESPRSGAQIAIPRRIVPDPSVMTIRYQICI